MSEVKPAQLEEVRAFLPPTLQPLLGILTWEQVTEMTSFFGGQTLWVPKLDHLKTCLVMYEVWQLRRVGLDFKTIGIRFSRDRYWARNRYRAAEAAYQRYQLNHVQPRPR